MHSITSDGLHEDVNKIINKPYLEEPDSDGKCVALVLISSVKTILSVVQSG